MEHEDPVPFIQIVANPNLSQNSNNFVPIPSPAATTTKSPPSSHFDEHYAPWHQANGHNLSSTLHHSPPGDVSEDKFASTNNHNNNLQFVAKLRPQHQQQSPRLPLSSASSSWSSLNRMTNVELVVVSSALVFFVVLIFGLATTCLYSIARKRGHRRRMARRVLVSPTHLAATRSNLVAHKHWPHQQQATATGDALEPPVGNGQPNYDQQHVIVAHNAKALASDEQRISIANTNGVHDNCYVTRLGDSSQRCLSTSSANFKLQYAPLQLPPSVNNVKLSAKTLGRRSADRSTSQHHQNPNNIHKSQLKFGTYQDSNVNHQHVRYNDQQREPDQLWLGRQRGNRKRAEYYFDCQNPCGHANKAPVQICNDKHSLLRSAGDVQNISEFYASTLRTKQKLMTNIENTAHRSKIRDCVTQQRRANYYFDASSSSTNSMIEPMEIVKCESIYTKDLHRAELLSSCQTSSSPASSCSSSAPTTTTLPSNKQNNDPDHHTCGHTKISTSDQVKLVESRREASKFIANEAAAKRLENIRHRPVASEITENLASAEFVFDTSSSSPSSIETADYTERHSAEANTENAKPIEQATSDTVSHKRHQVSSCGQPGLKNKNNVHDTGQGLYRSIEIDARLFKVEHQPAEENVEAEYEASSDMSSFRHSSIPVLKTKLRNSGN